MTLNLSRALACLSIGLAVGWYLHFAASFALPFPQYDDFHNILGWSGGLSKASTLSEVLKVVLLPQAEHQQLFLKMVMATQLAVLGELSFRGMIIIGNIAWCLGVLVLAVMGYRIHRNPWIPAIICIIGLQPQTYDSISFAAGSNNFAYLALSIAAICAARARGRVGIYSSLTLATASALTCASGFMTFPALAIQFALQKQRKAVIQVVFAGILLGFLYWIVGSWNPPPVGENVKVGWFDLLNYFTLFLGGTAGNIAITAGYVLGWGLLLAWIGLGLRFRDRVDPALFGLAAFCVLIAAAAAFSRSHLGLAQATSSRYALISLILFIATLLAILHLFREQTIRKIVPALFVAGVAFTLTAYTLYRPVVESQFRVTYWNTAAYSAGDATGIDVPSSEHLVGALDRAQAAGLLKTSSLTAVVNTPGLFPDSAPISEARVLPSSLPPLDDANLDFVGEAPNLVKFQGKTFVRDTDLLAADRRLILQNQDTAYLFRATPMFQTLPGNPRNAWVGFVALVNPESIPPGRYQVGIQVQAKGKQYLHFFEEVEFLGGSGVELVAGAWETEQGTVQLTPEGEKRLSWMEKDNQVQMAVLENGGLQLRTLDATGSVNQERTRIAWTNRTIWHRLNNSMGLGFPPIGRVIGEWKCGGGTGQILSHNTRLPGMTIINENGLAAKLFFKDSKLSVPSWDITGTIAEDGRAIHWSNNTVWLRP